MEEIKTREETVQSLLDMRRGDTLFFKIDEKSSAKLWLLNMEIVAMNNLFDSFVIRHGEPENNIQFNQLLERYTKSTADYIVTLESAVKEQLGEEIHLILKELSNGFAYHYDGNMEAVCILKRCPLPCLSKAA